MCRRIVRNNFTWLYPQKEYLIHKLKHTKLLTDVDFACANLVQCTVLLITNVLPVAAFPLGYRLTKDGNEPRPIVNRITNKYIKYTFSVFVALKVDHPIGCDNIFLWR